MKKLNLRSLYLDTTLVRLVLVAFGAGDLFSKVAGASLSVLTEFLSGLFFSSSPCFTVSVVRGCNAFILALCLGLRVRFFGLFFLVTTDLVSAGVVFGPLMLLRR
jgi:hypothetical protein